LQDSVVIVYNWIPTYTASQISPHSWITEYMKDLALPVNFVGTSTNDRRHILPQKEVGPLVPCDVASGLAVCLVALTAFCCTLSAQRTRRRFLMTHD